MARLRVRIRFNPGRSGAPLDRLGEFSSQMEKFLRSLANDVGIKTKKGEWLASNFTNESIAFDSEFAGSASEAEVIRGVNAIDVISGENPIEACNTGLINYGTLAQFSQIGKALEPDESYFIGLYRNGGGTPSKWNEVSYKKAAEIRQLLEAPYVSSGSIQGMMYSWNPGAQSAFFQIRELAVGSIIHCSYGSELYSRVHNAMKIAQSIVHVYGNIKWDRAANAIVDVEARDIEVAEPLSEEEFDRLFGSIPNFTSELSTSDYIEWLRGDGD